MTDRNSGTSPEIQQVRELLFGAAQRDLTGRNDELEALIKTVEDKLSARLDAQVEEMRRAARAAEEARLAGLREIGAQMTRLGESILSYVDAETDEGAERGSATVHRLETSENAAG